MEPSSLLVSLILCGGGLGAIKIQNYLNFIPSLNKVCYASFLLRYSFF